MTKKNSDKDNLEFNDGLGDLLREKESRQFSIQRTLIVLVVFVAVVFVVLLATVKLGTKFLFTSMDKPSTVQTTDIDSDALVRELAEMERLMAQKKESQATSDAVATEAQPTPAIKGVVPPAKKGNPVATVNSIAVAPKPVVPKNVVQDVPKVASRHPVVVSQPAAIKKQIKPKLEVGFPYKVIVGTFSNKTNALALKSELKNQGIDAFLWERDADGQRWHAVQAAAFSTQDSAQRVAAALRKKGYPAYVLRK